MDSAELELNSASKPRDFRMLGSGVFKTKRTIAWKFAYMYDGDKNTWLVRRQELLLVYLSCGDIFLWVAPRKDTPWLRR
jgi:phosphate-selective porin OprO/OprP